METRVLFIGLGLHARRIQYPYIMRRRKELGVTEVVTLDLLEQKEIVQSYLSRMPEDVKAHKYYTDKYIDTDLLDKIVDTHSITHVILGTDPEHHFKYARYALERSLRVMMDKPIVAIPHSIEDPNAAQLILDQFLELKDVYDKYPDSSLTVLCQRRYHPAYAKIVSDVVENYNRTKVIPHYLYLMHSDGQLRVLNEIDDISYHGFNTGYGKMSHSGYHFIDTLYCYLKYFIEKGEIDNFSLMAHHLSPLDYSMQIGPDSVKSILGTDGEVTPYNATAKGEIDMYVTMQFKKGDRLITTARLDMLHSGFSDRINFCANQKDLYKGNGRIRHEKQIILQGPIYAAYIDSLQSKQINLKEEDSQTSLGGEHHFDLIRFNHTSNGKKIATRDSIDDIMDITNLGYSRGHQEEARYYSLDDFFSSHRSKVSDLTDHHFSSLIMSSIYLAASTNKTISKEI